MNFQRLAAVSSFCFLYLIASQSSSKASVFHSTASFSGGFHISQNADGTRDYYFTPVNLDTSLAQSEIQVTSIDLTIAGQNTQPVSYLNWDLEAFAGPNSLGLPTGQFNSAVASTVTGFPRTSPVYYHTVPAGYVGFTSHYDFPSSSTLTFNTTDGLREQLFFWTGDTLGPYITFNSATLTVNGNVISVPEPVSAMSITVLATPMLLLRRRRCGVLA